MVDASVGPYRILAKLGAGGMGDVYLAEDTRLHRRVALKSLSEALLKGPGARETLLREARSAATLNHPNIAAIYDVVETGDTTHIVMEYVEGESLSHRLERGRLPPDEVAAVALQLCDAMAAAHAAGVVHRDLKPGNVSLTNDGKLKVLDFGLATRSGADAEPVAATDTTPSQGEAILGTPAYMAPEQLKREPSDRAHRHLQRRRDALRARDRPASLPGPRSRGSGRGDPDAAHPVRRRCGADGSARALGDHQARDGPLARGPFPVRACDAGGARPAAHRGLRIAHGVRRVPLGPHHPPCARA